MRFLVACEFSGKVRDALIARGHQAISCDLRPTDRPGPHIQDDIRKVNLSKFDGLIAFPPCTNLAVSGSKHFKHKHHLQEQDLALVRFLLTADVPLIALENPVSIISTHIRRPDQIIHPWQFGHKACKTTCLWLKGLPPLKYTRVVGPPPKRWEDEQEWRKWNKLHLLGQTKDRAKIRSTTFDGVARAMATQWTQRSSSSR